jgi:DNA polymerase II large subunit
MEPYFEALEHDVKNIYRLCSKARKKGLDPSPDVEVLLAKNMAERVVGLISVVSDKIRDTTIVQRIDELEKKYSAQDWRVALTIALEVAQEKFCSFEDKKEAMEIGIRIGVAYITNGVVSSPLEGFTRLEIKKRRDGGEYFALYFSGPIRSAGGTGASVSVLIGDYIRKHCGYQPYDPTPEEIKHIIAELYYYHERITNLQYYPSEEEISFMVQHVPVQISGDPSEKIEVGSYKGLERIETDRLRNGVCLVTGEGLCQKAGKVYKQLSTWGKDFGLDHWLFLKDFLVIQKKSKSQSTTPLEQGISADHTFVKDLVAGRPVFTHPLRNGGFRLRYGKTRSSGLSAQAIHPATMVVVNNFLAIGTQLKVERPGKSTVLANCSNLEGPIVKLQNGDVLQLYDVETARRVFPDIVEVIYLGDLLISYGDFFNRGHPLVPAGYCEEWWSLELAHAVHGRPLGDNKHLVTSLIQDPFSPLTAQDAVRLSTMYGIPLHPRYTFHWTSITKEDISLLVDWIAQGSVQEQKIILPYRDGPEKRALELLGVPCSVVGTEYVVLRGDEAFIMQECFKSLDLSKDSPLDVLNPSLSLRDKNGTFIGARMGRPEKAKMRKLTGSPQVLFPVGDEGGRLRSFQTALDKGLIHAQFPLRYCLSCKNETIYASCEVCGKETQQQYYCYACKKTSTTLCHDIAVPYTQRDIDIKHHFDACLKLLGMQHYPELIKGVRGTSNKDHVPEHLAKGILRALHNVYVNKDGTIRYDMTEMPLTHFKPCEIGTPIKVLKSLGYDKDISGAPLQHDDQLLELKIQDVILPAASESLDETADDVFFRVAGFLDDLLEKVYKLPRFYNLKSRSDLVGHLVLGLAPHISAGVVGRIIGFSKTQTILAHPYFHCIVRRDCDGDEMAVMLLVDTLLNFSRKYLPAHRGATQDTPLVLSSRIIPKEVDDMVFDMDVDWRYPLELYEGALSFKKPWEINVSRLQPRIGTKKEFTNFGFTHAVDNVNAGVQCSAYKSIPTMEDKVKGQLNIAEKLRAVDTNDVARLVVSRHFIRDIKGNLRKFSTQLFRCVTCNEKFRRPPLKGSCLKCDGKIIFTVAEGSIVKYLGPSLNLAEHYDISPYLTQTLLITQERIESIFGREKEKQEGLGKWF